MGTIAPNPASTMILAEYAINNGQRAHLTVVPVYGGGGGNRTVYELAIDNRQIELSVSSYVNGVYEVLLYCDGNLVGTQRLIINQ